MANTFPRIAFAGDRDIALWILEYLLSKDVQPLALLVSDPQKASHAQNLMQMCSFLPSNRVLTGKMFREQEGIELLSSLNLDFIVGIHFPYIFPQEILSLPRYGVLNLHPAYLPYNRGWHTPSWALLEQTPVGATLHFMAVGVDTGDIIRQKQLPVSPGDTAHTLYQKLKQLELEVFQEAWPHIANQHYTRFSQDPRAGTTHKRQELFSPDIQCIQLDERVTAGDLIRRLRALTTSQWAEAAYYEVDGKRYRIQVVIQEDTI